MLLLPPTYIYSLSPPNLMVLFLLPHQILAREEDSTINRNGQAPVSASDHYGAQDQFTHNVPGAAEAEGRPWYASRDTHAAVTGHDLEDDVEDGEGDGVALEAAIFDAHNKQNGDGQPGEVVRELATHLLAEEVAAGVGRELEARHGALEPANSAEFGVVFFLFLGRVVSIDAEAPFFVDVRVAHCNHNGVGGNIHHEDIDDLGSDAKVCYGHNIKST
jgi:hypothetical protein